MSGGVIAIDPGPTESALVMFDGATPTLLRYAPNDEILALLQTLRSSESPCAIEMIASYGMAVGAEVFETCVWIGRFMEAFGADRVHRITRGQIKMHLCHSMRAKDANVRQAILDKFGGKTAAIGSKRQPGPLYGITGDLWAALAVGITWWDVNKGPLAAGSESGEGNYVATKNALEDLI